MSFSSPSLCPRQRVYQELKYDDFSKFLRQAILPCGENEETKAKLRRLASNLCLVADKIEDWITKDNDDDEEKACRVTSTVTTQCRLSHDNRDATINELYPSPAVQPQVPPYTLSQEDSALEIAGRIISDQVGVSVAWIRDIFCQTTDYYVWADYGCPMWFIRDYALPATMKRKYGVNGGGAFVHYSHLVRPRRGDDDTEGRKCCVPTGQPTCFISYTGGTTALDFFTLLSDMKDKEYIWCDLFCVDQYAFEATRSFPCRKEIEKLFMQGLDNVVTNIGHTKLLLPDLGDMEQTIHKLWVIWELFVTVHHKVNFSLALRLGNRLNVCRQILGDGQSSSTFDRVLASIQNMDVRRSAVWKLQDKRMLLNRVAQAGGHKKVGKAVEKLVKDFLFLSAREQMEFYKQTAILQTIVKQVSYDEPFNFHTGVLEATDCLMRGEWNAAAASVHYCITSVSNVSELYFLPEYQCSICILYAVAIRKADYESMRHWRDDMRWIAGNSMKSAISYYALWLLQKTTLAYRIKAWIQRTSVWVRQLIGIEEDFRDSIFRYMLGDKLDRDLTEWYFMVFVRGWLSINAPSYLLMDNGAKMCTEIRPNMVRWGKSQAKVVKRSLILSYFPHEKDPVDGELKPLLAANQCFDEDVDDLLPLDPERWAYTAVKGITLVMTSDIAGGHDKLWEAFEGCLYYLGKDNALIIFILEIIVRGPCGRVFSDIEVEKAVKMVESADPLPKLKIFKGQDLNVAPWDMALYRRPPLMMEAFLDYGDAMQDLESSLRFKLLSWAMRSALIHTAPYKMREYLASYEIIVESIDLEENGGVDAKLFIIEFASLLAFAGHTKHAHELFMRAVTQITSHPFVDSMATERFKVFLHLRGLRHEDFFMECIVFED